MNLGFYAQPELFFLMWIIIKGGCVLYSWYRDLLMANFIATWYFAIHREYMRKKGVKFRRTPLPGRLCVIPCKFVVLSAVLQLMSRAAMARTPPPPLPNSWRSTFRTMLLPPVSQPEPAPDPDLAQPDSPSSSQPLAREGDDTENNSDLEAVCLECADLSDVPTFTVASSLLDHDLLACCTAHYSFGSVGLLSQSEDLFAIVDTGASMSVTAHRSDFIDYEPQADKVLKGLSAGASIAGIGTVLWQTEVNGRKHDLKLKALHVPESNARLLSPQQLLQAEPPLVTCSPTLGKEGMTLTFDPGPIDCPYNQANLPVLPLTCPEATNMNLHALNSCVTHETNQNLSAAQKELLKWHNKFGHLGFQRVQALLRSQALGQGPLIKAASKCTAPLCASCEYGKAKRRATRAKTSKVTSEKLLSKEALIPGQKVSMDHFIVSSPGRLFTSRGNEQMDKRFKGGVIFVDHASGYIFVSPVVNFTAGEAIRAKREFEHEMMDMGITVINYHTDNGVFTAAEFQDELTNLGQSMTLSGVGAHHQNAVAERAIGTSVSMARTMMIHAKLRWPKVVTPDLWPMAIKHAQYLLNHTQYISLKQVVQSILKPDAHTKDGKPYPPTTLYNIIAGIRRYYKQEHNRPDLNFLDEENHWFASFRD